MVSLYWKNATAAVVGDANGLTDADLEAVGPKVTAAHAAVLAALEQGKLGYAALPQRREYRDSVMALVEKFRPDTTDLVVLGIGGSALGNIALQTALNSPTYNLMGEKRKGPRLFVLDNIDPATIYETLVLIGRRVKTTVFNVISKSGETAETASQFMIFREQLRERVGADFAKQIVATTDPAGGTLHTIAAADGYATLVVPPDVGGRFSVLSPVGLFSAGMCGIDIDGLLRGAAGMGERFKHTDDWKANPACVLAAIKYLMLTAKGKPIHVMMPYSNRLYGLADWYRQLWAESLGKAKDRQGREVHVGPTPIKALGTTDQHSQVQLYREGPNDKLMVFVEAARHAANMTIPDVFGDVPGLAYLRKVTLAKLLAAEKTATEYALAKSGRPSVTIRFEDIDEPSVGGFIMLYELVTSLMGELLDINAYDQPAVELGKQATFALLGRPGYEDLAKEIQPFVKPDRAYIV